MKDGKIVELLGVNYPAGRDGAPSDIALAAKQRLDALLKDGTEVSIFQSFNAKTGRANRMGHVLAHLARKQDDLWINGELVDGGFARVLTTASNPEMAEQLYALEQQARATGKGLWNSSSPVRLMTVDEIERASPGGDIFVIEGTVNRAATSNNNLYLNFGSDWKKDFTVQITPALRKALARKGIDAMALGGQRLRVRGWVRSWNGPFMELEAPERLEIVGDAAASEIPASPMPEEPPAPPTTLRQNP